MTYLEASRFKALNIMMDLESRPRVTHSLSSYIDYSKDKQGLTAATLKIPSWVRTEPLPPTPQIDLPPIPGVLDWADRGTADGGSPDSQKGSRSPHIQTTVGVSVSDKNSPVFTTMNPIMVSVESDSDTSQHIRDSDIDTSQLMMRGRGDGDGGLDNDDDSGVKTTHDDSDIVNVDDNLPDSDFDDFDSNDDEEPSFEGAGETAGSQDNEI